MRLKEISLDQRPRERLKSKGIDSLNDSEILALLLENGSQGENVIDLSHRLISTFGLERSHNVQYFVTFCLQNVGRAQSEPQNMCYMNKTTGFVVSVAKIGFDGDFENIYIGINLFNSKMNRLLLLTLSIATIFSLIGCTTQTNKDLNSQDYQIKSSDKNNDWQENAPSKQYVGNVNQIANDFGEDPEYVDRIIRAAVNAEYP